MKEDPADILFDLGKTCMSILLGMLGIGVIVLLMATMAESAISLGANLQLEDPDKARNFLHSAGILALVVFGLGVVCFVIALILRKTTKPHNEKGLRTGREIVR